MLTSPARLALPAVLGVALVAGCGGASGTTSPKLSPVARIQNASDVTRKAGSSAFEQTTVSTINGKDTLTKAAGAVDPGKGTGNITIALGKPGGDQLTTQERILDGNLYIQVPGRTDSFYELAMSDLVGTSFAAAADPTAGFESLKAAGSDIKKVGQEKVRGTDTTHYEGTYDAKGALDKLTGTAKDLVASVVQQGSLKAIPYDAWLDGKGRVRRFVQTLDLTTNLDQPQKVHTTSTIEVFDFGKAVTVTAPPPEQIKDSAGILAALKGTASGGN